MNPEAGCQHPFLQLGTTVRESMESAEKEGDWLVT